MATIKPFTVNNGLEVNSNANVATYVSAYDYYQTAVLGPIQQPSFAVDLVNTNRLDSRILFTRASKASYVNSQGVIAYADINEPRFESRSESPYSQLGLLIEESRANRLIFSGELHRYTGSGGTAVANTNITAPDGTFTATTFTENTDTSHYIPVNFHSTPPSLGTVFTVSVFVKPNGRTKFQIQTGGDNLVCQFYLDTLTFNISTAIAGSASITPFNNGWYRCSASFTAGAALNSILLILLDNTPTGSYQGDEVSGMHFWGAQSENGSWATSYIPTTDVSATRALDVANVQDGAFRNFFNQSAGTLYAKYIRLVSATGGLTGRVFSLTDVTRLNIMELYISSIMEPGGQFVSEGVDQASYIIGAVAANTLIKSAITYGISNTNVFYNAASNGTLGGNATKLAIDIPLVDRADIGNRDSLTRPLNGYIQQIRYYPTRLSDSDLQVLTT